MVFVLYIIVNITISSEYKTHSISQFCDYPFEILFILTNSLTLFSIECLIPCLGEIDVVVFFYQMQCICYLQPF